MRRRRTTTTRNRKEAAQLFSRANLLATYEQATETDRLDGRSWYYVANEHARKLSALHGLTVCQGVGIIAALSPQTSWEENIRIAHALCEDPTSSHHTADATGKALRILNGADPETTLGGRKVRSFYANILYPHVPGHVTIDRHAAAILAGLTTPEWNRMHEKKLERAHFYRFATGVYRAAARDLSLLPHQLQAITWLVQSNRSVNDAIGVDYGSF